MGDSYKPRMDATNQHLAAKYLKRVVSQPTVQSNKRVVIDKTTYTGIREDKRNAKDT
jgi:hypothetical protein